LLTETQSQILSKGLKFIPNTNSRSWSRTLSKDLRDFKRRLLLHTFFRGKPKSVQSSFSLKSTWCPPTEILEPQIQDAFKEAEYLRIQVAPQFRARHNTSVAEMTAIKTLRANTSIIINKADKGNNIVLQSKKDYIWEVSRQLSIPNHYEKLSEPIYPSTALKINRIVCQLKTAGYITEREMQYLRPPANPKPRRLYTLPKIHKPPEQWSVPFCIPPGRPIISDIDSESYHIAEYIDHFLKPITFIQPSYIKDSFHFLDKIKQVKIDNRDFFLVTCDVESMYTNINNTDGLKTVEFFFNRHPDAKRPDKHILDLLNISLNNNDFLFNGSFWLQKSGTAMGKIFAPSYANLFMAKIEEDFFSIIGYRPPFYSRFLDDIFFIWTESYNKLLSFIDLFNAFHRSIKLTHRISQTEIDFLDICIYTQPFGDSFNLGSRVHFKPTNTHRLLHKHSFHPKHTFAGIIKGQLTRYFRLCSDITDFHKATSILFRELRNMKYSIRFLYDIKAKLLKDLKNGYQPVTKNYQGLTLLPLVYTHHESSHYVCRSLIDILKNLNTEALEDCILFKACRRNRNLADMLIRNKI